jgi:hypothetical protein
MAQDNSYNIYDVTHSRGKYKILVKNGKTPAENVDVGFYIPADPNARDSKNLILRPEDDKFPSKWNGNCVNLVGKWVLETFPKNKKVNEYEFEDIPEFRNWCGLPHNMSELYLDYYLNDMQKKVADRKREAMLLRTPPPPPPSVKIPNTQPIKQKQHGSTQPSPSIVDFEWPPFDEDLFNKICNKFVDDINNIKKKHIPPEDYRDNDVTCCSPALKNIAKDLIMLFMKHKITTPHTTSDYANGYKVLILSVIGYHFMQNEWEHAFDRMKIFLPAVLFKDSMMVIMEMVKSGFGHDHPDHPGLDSELREITKRLFVVDNWSIQKPNDGGGRKRSTRRRKLKPSKRRTKMK